MLTLATPLAPSHPTRPKLSKQASKCACASGGQKWAERPRSEVGSRGPRGGAGGGGAGPCVLVLLLGSRLLSPGTVWGRAEEAPGRV